MANAVFRMLKKETGFMRVLLKFPIIFIAWGLA